MTEQQEDPSKPLFRRWNDIGFCQRGRAMREHNLGAKEPKFNFTVQPKSVIRVNYKSLTLK